MTQRRTPQKTTRRRTVNPEADISVVRRYFGLSARETLEEILMAGMTPGELADLARAIRDNG